MNLVVIQNRRAVTSSLQVAEVFEKEHKNVLQTIDNLAAENSAVKNMFFESTYENRGKHYKMYYMNRDGFTLLAMGFTGKKALDFKLQYIDAFNQMEEQLKTPSQPSYQIDDPIARAQQWIREQQEKQQLTLQNQVFQQQIAEMQPKVSYHDLVLQNKSLVTISVIAKDFGMSGKALNKKLKDLGVQYYQSGVWLLYSKYQDKGYTQTTTHVVNEDLAKVNTKWTQKGRLFIYELLKKQGILPLIERESDAS